MAVEDNELDQGTIDAGVDDVMSGLGEDLTGTEWKADATPTTEDETPLSDDPPEGDVPPVVPAESTGVPPPETWTSPTDAALWAKLPPEAQTALTQREAQYQEALGQYRATSDIGVRLGKIVEPYLEHYQRAGMGVWDVLPDVMGAHAVMMFGRPEQKADMFRALAHEVGVDVTQLAQPGGAAATSQVADLQRTVKTLQQHIAGVTSTMQQQRIDEQTDHILAFGDSPEHPHFWDLQEDVMRLMTSGVARNLESAYEQAVWANPQTRAKEIERQTRERDAQRTVATKARTDAAKRATAVNLGQRASGRAMGRPAGSVDDTLRSTLDSILARDA